MMKKGPLTQRGQPRYFEYKVCIGSLLIIFSIYFLYYMFLPSYDCEFDHQMLTPAAYKLHTPEYHKMLAKKWNPERFHDNATRWRDCIAQTHPEYIPVEEYKERPVFVWTWHTLENFLFIHQDSVRNCPVPCYIANDVKPSPECMEEVDGFIFHPPTTAHRPYEPKVKHPYQFWILFATETELNYPIMTDPNYMQKFDINMTYHLKDDVPFTYFIDIEFYTTYWPLTPKTEKAPIMMMISNCEAKSPRNQYLAELARYIEIDSYGKCLHNKDIPKELDGLPWWEVKWNLTSRYKFVIAIENSIVTDYVTEKLYHSLIVGTVPIYLGAPNIEDFLPSKKSIVKVADYAGPKQLAEYIRFLANNEDEYAKYQEWKKVGPSQSFLDLQNTSPRSGPCRLCQKIAEKQNKVPSPKEAHINHHHRKDWK